MYSNCRSLIRCYIFRIRMRRPRRSGFRWRVRPGNGWCGDNQRRGQKKDPHEIPHAWTVCRTLSPRHPGLNPARFALRLTASQHQPAHVVGVYACWYILARINSAVRTSRLASDLGRRLLEHLRYCETELAVRGKMSRLQNFALGMVLVVMGVAALFQIIHVDPVLRTVSIAALSVVSILAAMVFFLFAFRQD